MLKNSLFSTLFLFQPFSFFLLQHRTSLPFYVSVSHAAVLLQPSFSFLFVCCPLFFNPKYFFSSTNVFQLFSPKRFCFGPKPFFSSTHTTISASFCFVSAFFLFVQRLLFFFLFQRLILFFLPTSKAKNILFRCFTFLLFE